MAIDETPIDIMECTAKPRTIEEALLDLERHRRVAAGFRKYHSDKLAEFEAGMASIKAEIRHLDGLAEEARKDVEAFAYTIANESGNFKPHPAVQIKQMTRLEYDPNMAWRWAMDHQLYLNLDQRAFEKHAKANPGSVPFVQTRIEPQVSIATDLTKALGVEVK